MKKTLIALVVLVPAMAVAQEKYTNADLNIPPKKDAYTNADVERLPPLPVQRAPLAQVAPLPRARDLDAEARSSRMRSLMEDRDAIQAEMTYLKALRKRARYPGVGRNAYPRFGSDTAEARQRLKALERNLFLLEEEMGHLR